MNKVKETLAVITIIYALATFTSSGFKLAFGDCSKDYYIDYIIWSKLFCEVIDD